MKKVEEKERRGIGTTFSTMASQNSYGRERAALIGKLLYGTRPRESK